MGYPENPNTIIVQNIYYPNGLTEGDIWNYYQKYKGKLLNETRSRYLVVFISIDINKVIVRRKTKDDKYIILNNGNYNNMITGRTLSFHSTMKMYEDIGIVDIDCNKFDLAKIATFDVYRQLSKISSERQIRFTGKTSFHVICKFNGKKKPDVIKDILRHTLQPLSNQYTIQHKRSEGIPNLDLAPNKFNGAYITLNSLSTLGLRCIEVDPYKLKTFRPLNALAK